MGTVIKKPQRFLLQLLYRLEELENDAGRKFLQNLDNGDTIGYKSDLGNLPEVFHGEQNSVSTTNREFLVNYNTVLGEEEALHKVIDRDLEEGQVSCHLPESELRSKYPQVLLNSSDGGCVGGGDRRSQKTRCQNTCLRNAGRGTTNTFFLQ